MKNYQTLEITAVLALGIMFAAAEPARAQEDKTIQGDRTIIENIPFITQAPQGHWNTEPWANACEETSLSMVDIFYDIQLQNSDANKLAYKMEIEGDTHAQSKIILDMLGLKNDVFGITEDETPHMMRAVIAKNLQWYAQVAINPTVEDLKAQIDLNRPVILPVYGELLYNGQYAYPGPDYHVGVLVGYTNDTFIMHDPGTNRGNYIEYNIETVMDSMESLVNNGFMEQKSAVFTAPNSESYNFDHLDSRTGQHDLRKINVIEAAENMYQETITPGVELIAMVRKLISVVVYG